MYALIKTWLGTALLLTIAVATCFFIWQYELSQPEIAVAQPIKIRRICVRETMLCPDGSTVGVIGTSCEFAACPGMVGIGDKIIITTPAKDAIITNPVTISGRARGTWFFEGSFPVEIYDEKNKLLASGKARSIPESENVKWATNGYFDFKGEIRFDRPSINSGYILFRKDDAAGSPGGEKKLYKLPVGFLANLPGGVDQNRTEKCYSETMSNKDKLIDPSQPNPASMFCSCVGGKSSIKETAIGQQGLCTIGTETYDEWEYFYKMNPEDNNS